MTFWVTDAERGYREVTGPVRVGPADTALGTLFAVDTFRRTADLLRVPVEVRGVPDDLGRFNIKPSTTHADVDLLLHRPGELVWSVGDDPLAVRLAWLSGAPVAQALQELTAWRALVAEWAEAPSRPMCAQVQEDLLAALTDDLATQVAVGVLRDSLTLELPPGCLFETWAWADRMLALDLATDVGR